MVKQILAKYREEKRKHAYCDGFGWAMSAFFVEKQSQIEIESYIFNRHSDFDQGAQEALSILVKHFDDGTI